MLPIHWELLGVGHAPVGQSGFAIGNGRFDLHVTLASVGEGHLWFLEASSGPRSMA